MSLQVSVQHRFESFALDVAFEVPQGVTVLFGPSGSGKTSLIRAVAGLLRPDQARIALGGRIWADGKMWLPPHKRRIGYVFQDHRLLPHLSVAANLEYGAGFAPKEATGLPKGEVIEMLGLSGLMNRRPRALSGGEAARVGLGRALLAKPQMLLADEPLASLDEARKAEILPYFEALRDRLDIPVLYVSHAMGEVARLATSVVALKEGRVLKVGPAQEVLSDPDVAPGGPRSVGAVLMARVKAHHEDGLSELDAGGVSLFLPKVRGAVGREVRVRIAAQDVMISKGAPEGLSALNNIPARVAQVLAGKGPGAVLVLESAAGRILARITKRSLAALEISEGSEVYAVVKTVSVAPEDVGSSAP